MRVLTNTMAASALVGVVVGGAAWAQQTPPAFTNPTRIRNPYLPVSLIRQSITLGQTEGEDYRTEVTLLPGTRAITWSGGTTPARISQYVAYQDGELVEVAYDYFAQGDDGSVWYFGEDVFNYQDGEIVDMEGTWLAGRDGAPPGLIMPGSPVVGQVFFPENFAPEVFEEATVVSLSEPTTTPFGPRGEGLLILETLLDGSQEHKVYVPGIGETEVRAPDEQLNLALLIRTDTPQYLIPRNLDLIESLAEEVVIDVPDWSDVDRKAGRIAAAWVVYRPRAIRAGAPEAFVAAMDRSVEGLVRHAANRRPRATREAAADTLKAALDIIALYNPPVPVDLDRIAAVQIDLMLDVGFHDWVSAKGEHSTATDALWGRLRPWVARRDEGTPLAVRLDNALAAQSAAIEAQNQLAVAAAFREILEVLDLIEDDVY